MYRADMEKQMPLGFGLKLFGYLPVLCAEQLLQISRKPLDLLNVRAEHLST